MDTAMDVQIAIALAKLFDHLRGKLISINYYGYGEKAQTRIAVFPRAMAEIAPLSQWTITRVEPTYPDGRTRYYQFEASVMVDGVLFTSLPCEEDIPDEFRPVPVEMHVAVMAEAIPV